MIIIYYNENMMRPTVIGESNKKRAQSAFPAMFDYQRLFGI